MEYTTLKAWIWMASMGDQPHKDADTGLRTPPYVSFSTFQTMIGDFKENGIPPRVDRSVLTRFAGGLASQLIMSLKSLGITDERNQPTDQGRAFIGSFGTNDYKARLREILGNGYPFLAKLDLTDATPSMFAEAFKSGTGAKEDVLRKCRTFFVHAAQVAEMPLGPRLQAGKVSRSGSTARRKTKTAKPKAAEAPILTPGTNLSQPDQSVKAKLLDKFPPFDPAWGPEIQAAWFEGYGRLLAMGEKA